MAEIVFGMAIAHSGMLGKPGATWLDDGERDRRNPQLIYQNQRWDYADLAEHRKAEGFERYLTLEEREARYKQCRAAIHAMRKAYDAAKADIVIIIGKDQKEMFTEISPAFAIYSGAEIYNGPPQRSMFSPDHAVTYAGVPDLAKHLLASLQDGGFDMTDIIKWPANQWMGGTPIVPHAFGFVYQQIIDGEFPVPSVPVFINTFFAPTQPSMARAIAFGEALTAAVHAWNSDKRVAIIATGGLSHFVVDEDFDRMIIDLLAKGDLDGLAAVDDRSYQSGNSEIKLYAPIAVAMKGTPMTLVDYVPCYRTEAGTGEGMGFMYWAKD
jgi:hypothetical protein